MARRLDWDRARERDQQREARASRPRRATGKQVAMIRSLRRELGVDDPVVPETSELASSEIDLLLKAKRQRRVPG